MLAQLVWGTIHIWSGGTIYVPGPNILLQTQQKIIQAYNSSLLELLLSADSEAEFTVNSAILLMSTFDGPRDVHEHVTGIYLTKTGARRRNRALGFF